MDQGQGFDLKISDIRAQFYGIIQIRLDLGHLCMRMMRGLVFMLMVDERFEGSLDVGECDGFEGVLGLGRGLGGQTRAQG